MNDQASLAVIIAAIALLYATAGQAGGTAFLAVMALASFPAEQMRPTALLLNVVAFAGGLVVLESRVYLVLTGLLLLAAATLMLLRRTADTVQIRPVATGSALLAGAATGFLAGLTGIGGGAFLAPLIIALGWVSPRQAASLSTPYILANSVIGFAGAAAAGQHVAPGITMYAVAALIGAAMGSAIGARWMSNRLTRYMLALILAVAGLRLLLR
jgi:uncharacterized membrane protein YfcA